MTALRSDEAYLPALDGLRAVSIIMVLLSHIGKPGQSLAPGLLGVLIFFVISGFLLTRQMAAEIERTGTLDVRRFYLRRLLRLIPALLVYITLFGAVMSWQGVIITPVHILSALFYFVNYYHIFIGYPPHSPLPILWSLSVEEHFYIVFPFVMLAFRRRLPSLLPWLGAAMLAALAWRIALYALCSGDPGGGVCGLEYPDRLHGTDTLFDCILCGAATALALHHRPAAVQRLLMTRGAFIASLALLVLTLAVRNEAFRDTLRFSLQSSAVAAIILNVLFAPHALAALACRILSLPPMLLIGRLSYSLYLFHYGVLMFMESACGLTIDPHHPAALGVYLAASLALAVASYTLIEKPTLRLRRRFGSHAKG